MRFIKNIMSRKPSDEELDAPIATDMEDVEPLRRKARSPEADDTGDLNASVQREKLAEAQRLFGLKAESGTNPTSPLMDPAPEADPALAAEDDWDDDWDDDEEWGDGWEDDSAAAGQDKEHLVNEIREAMGAMSHVAPEERPATSTPALMQATGEKNWAEDEEFGRKALARNQLGARASEARLLEEAEDKFGDDEGSRRRSAMAHLKAAAQATKADRVLSSTVGRDAAGDPEEQSPYRADLAKVVRPRPVSRPALTDELDDKTLEEIATEEENEAAWMDADIDFDDPVEDEADAEAPTPEAPADVNAAFAEPAPDAAASAPSPTSEPRRTRMMTPDDQHQAQALADSLSEPRTASPKIWDLGEGSDDSADAAASGSAWDDTPSRSAPQAEARPGPRGLSALSPQLDPMTQPRATEGGGAVAPAAPVAGLGKMPAPGAGRAGRGAGRVKTRLLGFQGGDQSTDIFAQDKAEPVEAGQPAMFPVGWIVVTDGPGRGASFTLFDGVSQIGRGEDQAIKLDFGDTAISRQNHAAVAFDHEQSKFFLGHGGKSNLVRLNDRPVLSTEELTDGDRVRIGETTLLFIALCTEDFGWTSKEGDGPDHAAFA